MDIKKQTIEDIKKIIIGYKEQELRGDYSDVHFAENETNRKLIDWIIEEIEKYEKSYYNPHLPKTSEIGRAHV